MTEETDLVEYRDFKQKSVLNRNEQGGLTTSYDYTFMYDFILWPSAIFIRIPQR